MNINKDNNWFYSKEKIFLYIADNTFVYFHIIQLLWIEPEMTAGPKLPELAGTSEESLGIDHVQLTDWIVSSLMDSSDRL